MSYLTIFSICTGFCAGFLAVMLVLSGREDEPASPLNTPAISWWIPSSEQREVGSKSTTDKEIAALGDGVAKRVRIFCWIATHRDNHATRAVHVKATWAHRCNGYAFMSTEEDPSLPAINLNIPNGREHLWEKTKAAFTYVYQHYDMKEYDWFMKIDDDSYVVVDNLRLMLMPLDPDTPYYYGSHYSPRERPGELYMNGGCGYLLSRAALTAMVERGLNDSSKCAPGAGRGEEDWEMGPCMRALDVVWGDSRDAEGRHRFLPGPPDWFLGVEMPEGKDWLRRETYYPLMQGPNCCSDYAVSFHYVSVPMMYVLDYFAYRFRNPAGGRQGSVPIPAKLLKEHLRELYSIAIANTGPNDASRGNVSMLSAFGKLPKHLSFLKDID